MVRRRRLPMFVLAAGLFGLIVVLATLQYRWLGQISAAERTRVGAMLHDNASGFAEDFDRELNRAYLMFQVVPVAANDGLPAQVSARYDRWLATSQYPRMVREVYLASVESSGLTLRRFNPSTRYLEPAEWPEALVPVRARIGTVDVHPVGPGAALMHGPVQTLWPEVPALVVSAPLVVVDRFSDRAHDIPLPPAPSYCILLLDSDYIRREMLPALARHYFQSPSGGFEYELAVVPTKGSGVVYHSASEFNPPAAAKVDASADLFNLRVQDFGPLVSEISRFAMFATYAPVPVPGRTGVTARAETVIRQTTGEALKGTLTLPNSSMSIVVQQKGVDGVTTTFGGDTPQGNARFAVSTVAHWRLLVQHPSGSLEQAVNSVRRRNLLISTGILSLLAVSVGFLVVSTRRAHDLARQQLEFVATVSHELRTPLAVIRSAADNLADGIVGDDTRVRQYGELVRSEGLRLTALVEQILEFAGLQAGQRAMARQPLLVGALLRQAVEESQSSAEASGVRLDVSISDDLPAIGGDEAALRRVFANLIGNAIKYGGQGRWVGIRAQGDRDGVSVAVSDHGIGIPPAEQDRIFEPFYRAPDVVAAQIQGAGLGLSLVKRIVEAHGGRITVTSSPGEGSTFTVTLPSIPGIPRESGVSSAAPQPS